MLLCRKPRKLLVAGFGRAATFKRLVAGNSLRFDAFHQSNRTEPSPPSERTLCRPSILADGIRDVDVKELLWEASPAIEEGVQVSVVS